MERIGALDVVSFRRFVNGAGAPVVHGAGRGLMNGADCWARVRGVGRGTW